MNRPTTTYPLKLTICGMDELSGYASARVSHVLSILDPATPEPAAFARYGTHRRLELRFHDVIEDAIDGYEPPKRQHIEDLLEFDRSIDRSSDERPHVLVHCHMGISRSTAAATLLLAEAAPEAPPELIIAEVARIRPKAWPNLRMIEFGDQLLGRNGAIVRAVKARHRMMAANLPQVAEYMRSCGRARELD